MADGKLTVSQVLDAIRRIEGFEDCSDRVGKLVFKMMMNKDAKKIAVDKAADKVRQIVNNLNAITKDSHLFNDDPTAWQKINLDAIQPIIDLANQRFTEKDTVKHIIKSGPVTPLPQYAVVHVDTPESVAAMVNTIVDYHHQRAETPAIYVDMEGDNLGRHGTLALLQIFVPAAHIIYIVYISILGAAAFDTIGTDLKIRTLKDIFETVDVVKAFWDCRAGSDALYSLYGVQIDPTAVVDLQLLECAIAKDARSRKMVHTLFETVVRRLNIPKVEQTAWVETKMEGENIMQDGLDHLTKQARDVRKADLIFRSIWATTGQERAQASKEYSEMAADTEEVESVKVWAECPLRPVMLQHAVGDVVVLPLLYRYLTNHAQLNLLRKQAVRVEAARRIEESQASEVPAATSDAPSGWAEKSWCEEDQTTSIVISPPMTLAERALAEDEDVNDKTADSVYEDMDSLY